MTQRRYVLPESDIPTHWYNVAADLKAPPPPPLHPGTREPIGPDALAPLFPMGLIMQEVSQDRFVAIPDPVREVLAMWRPTCRRGEPGTEVIGSVVATSQVLLGS